MTRWLIVLSILLMACGPSRGRSAGGNGGISGDDDDDRGTGSDDDDAADDNRWPRSNAPDDYRGTGHDVGDQAHELSGLDQFGDDIDLTQFYGALVQVTLSAAWSPPDRTHAEALQALHDEVEDAGDWQFFAITVLIDNIDSERASVSDAQEWADQFGITEPIIVGSGLDGAREDWGLRAFPSHFVLDPMFRIREAREGGSIDPEELIDHAEQFLEDTPGWEDPL